VNPILGLKYARRLGLDPTPVPYGMDTLVLDGPEALDLDDARGRAAGGALVLSVLGVHTQDPSSGDFSLSAPQSLALDREGVSGRLRATISGNVFDLLRADDLRLVRFEGEHTPGLLARIRLD
jgi:PmbA protein